MKLTLLARSMEVGGMQRQLVELAGRLDALGVRAEVVLFYGGGELLPDLQRTGVPVQVLHKKHRYDVTGFSAQLVRHLRRSRPDAVYAWLPVPSVVASVVAPVAGRPRVVWAVRQSAARLDRYDRALRWAFQASRVLVRTADLVICNSEAGRRDHVAAGYPSHRTVVVPNGIDTARFVVDRDAGRPWRDRWGIGPQELLVGLPARLDPVKGHLVFVEAADELRRRGRTLRFAVIGGGSSDVREEFTARAHELGLHDLVVEGEVLDMLGVYNALDLVVLPSLWGEGFPNVVGEAMACGVPVVVSDVGDGASVLGPLGEVAARGDAASLADAVERQLDRLAAEELAEPLRARVESLFSSEQMALATVNAIRSVM